MKKIALSLALSASFLMANESILGEFSEALTGEPAMFSANGELWYITWDQTSTSSDFLQNKSDALDTTYNIDKAPAAALVFNFNWKFISTNLKYFDSDGASGLGFDIALLELIPYINVEARYVKADFNGGITSKTATGGSLSSATFKSQLNIMDFIVYPMNRYLGVGYRTYKYELPQDVYLQDNSDNHLVTAGLIDVSYEGSFVTLVLNNTKEVSARQNYNGLVYDAILGYGKLEPKTNGFDRWIETSDAFFYDLSVGYSLKAQSDLGFGYGVEVGYRYNKIATTANKASNANNYSLMTEFNTEFHGPYLSANVHF